MHRVMHPETFATVVPNVSDRKTWTDPMLATVSVNAKRIKMFRHSPTCTCCERTIDVYTVEQLDKEGSLPYINAYSVSRGIHEMTVDHLLPKGFCGGDSLINRVTKCKPCNNKKAVLMTLPEIATVSADLKRYTKDWANHDFVTTALEFQSFIHTQQSSTRKRAIGILNACAQSTSMRMSKRSYAQRIKQMKDFMRAVNPPAPPVLAPVSQPVQLSWWQRVQMFTYDLLTFFPK